MYTIIKTPFATCVLKQNEDGTVTSFPFTPAYPEYAEIILLIEAGEISVPPDPVPQQ